MNCLKEAGGDALIERNESGEPDGPLLAVTQKEVEKHCNEQARDDDAHKATNGGPGTYIQFGPHDRKGYKGDFLTIRHLRNGELEFNGYHRPEWPSNSSD